MSDNNSSPDKNSTSKKVNDELWKSFQRYVKGNDEDKSKAVEIFFDHYDKLPTESLELAKQLANSSQPKSVRVAIARKLSKGKHVTVGAWQALFPILSTDKDNDVKEELKEAIVKHEKTKEMILGPLYKSGVPRAFPLATEVAAEQLRRISAMNLAIPDWMRGGRSRPKIAPELDLAKIRDDREIIALIELIPLEKWESLKEYISKMCGKTLDSIKDFRHSSFQEKTEKIVLPTSMIPAAAKVTVHITYHIGQYLELIFLCELLSDKKGTEGDERTRMRLLQKDIEVSIPPELQGFFFANASARTEISNIVLPSLSIYNVSAFKQFLERDDSITFAVWSSTRNLGEGFAREFVSKKGGKPVNLLEQVGFNPGLLFAMIDKTLIVSRDKDTFEYTFAAIPNRFVALNFLPRPQLDGDLDSKIVRFIIQLVLCIHVDTIMRNLKSDIERIIVPKYGAGPLTTSELNQLKDKARVLNESLNKLDELKQQYYFGLIDSLTEDTSLFTDEETWKSGIKEGHHAKSISDYFISQFIESKRILDSLIPSKMSRVKDYTDAINSELQLKGNKPMVNSFLKDVEDQLIEQILKWTDKIHQSEIEAWLLNFESREERLLGLKLLNKLSYIKDNEIEMLCKSLLNKIKAELKTESFDTSIFSHIGTITGGSAHVIKPFQEANKLPKELFVENGRLGELKGKTSLILLDDFIGSGNTFAKWVVEHKSVLANFQRIYYCVLAAFKKGVDKIENDTGIKVFFGVLYDYDSMAIDGKLFEESDRGKMKDLVLKYKSRLPEKSIWGYDDCQLLVAFEKNIPNNSLSILWASNTWTPLIDRR